MQGYRSLAFAPDGRWLAAGDTLGVVWRWDLASAQAPLAMARQARENATAWELARQGALYTYFRVDLPALAYSDNGRHAIDCRAFSPDGATLATGDTNRRITITLWDLHGSGRVTLTGHTGPVHAVAFSPQGTVLASGADAPQGAGEVFLWPAPAGDARP